MVCENGQTELNVACVCTGEMSAYVCVCVCVHAYPHVCIILIEASIFSGHCKRDSVIPHKRLTNSSLLELCLIMHFFQIVPHL